MSAEGKEMLANSVELDANKQSDEGMRFNDLESKRMLKKWGESIESSLAWLILFGLSS